MEPTVSRNRKWFMTGLSIVGIATALALAGCGTAQDGPDEHYAGYTDECVVSMTGSGQSFTRDAVEPVALHKPYKPGGGNNTGTTSGGGTNSGGSTNQQRPPAVAPTQRSGSTTGTATSAPRTSPTQGSLPTAGPGAITATLPSSALSTTKVARPGEQPYNPPKLERQPQATVDVAKNNFTDYFVNSKKKPKSYTSPVTGHLYIWFAADYWDDDVYQDLFNPYDIRNYTHPFSPFYGLAYPDFNESDC